MKEKGTAALLAFLLGGIGIHRFYLGQTGLGLLYLFLCWTFIPAVIALIDCIVFLSMTKESFDKTYNMTTVPAQSWKCNKCGQSFTGLLAECGNCGHPMTYPESAYEKIKYTCNECKKFFFGRKKECPHCHKQLKW